VDGHLFVGGKRDYAYNTTKVVGILIGIGGILTLLLARLAMVSRSYHPAEDIILYQLSILLGIGLVIVALSFIVIGFWDQHEQQSSASKFPHAP